MEEGEGRKGSSWNLLIPIESSNEFYKDFIPDKLELWTKKTLTLTRFIL